MSKFNNLSTQKSSISFQFFLQKIAFKMFSLILLNLLQELYSPKYIEKTLASF
jgi:hypothetical protein